MTEDTVSGPRAAESPRGLLDRLFRLDGEVAVVAGGAGRIGRVLCGALAEVGAAVVVLDTAEEAAASLARDLSKRSRPVLALSVDVTREDDLRRAVAEIGQRLGPPRILINATQFRGQGFYSSDPSDYPRAAWEQVIAVNLTGTFLTCQAFGQAMMAAGGGRIVNLSSTYGVVSADPRIYGASGVNSPISYAAAKAGVVNLTRYLAVHWREKNIRVNCLIPGGVLDGQAEEFVAAYCARTPLGRMAHADDYVGAVLFMASEASAYMTGAALTVDGGWTAW